MFSRSKVIEIVSRLSDFLFMFSANLISIYLRFSILISFRFLSRTIFLTNLSLYTDVVYLFVLFENIGEFSSEARARETKIHNVCSHLWEKRGLLSPSPPPPPPPPCQRLIIITSSLAVPIKLDQWNWRYKLLG